MLLRVCCCLLLIAGLAPVIVASAAESIPPRVPGFERFHTAPLMTLDEEVIPVDPVTGGRLLLGELNCLSCHAASNEIKGVVSTKQAPILDEIGGRARIDWLREYLAQPHSIKPGTTMPDMIAALPEAERAGAVEALVHFLATTGSVTESHPDRGAAKKGAATFRKVGCAACHPVGESASAEGKSGDTTLANLATTIPLPDVGKKYTVPSLMAFLKDPLKVRPSGRMPALGLKDEEYRDIAQHFVDAVELSPNMTFMTFEHGGDDFPAVINAHSQKRQGTCAGFDLTVAERTNNFFIRFVTNLKITKPGQYQIHLGSDDGSRVYVGKELVVENGGVHPHQVKSGKVQLDVGFHPVIVDYFQGGGEWTLDVDLSGVGIKQQPLANHASLEAKEPEAKTAGPQTKQTAFAVDATLAEKGRALFGSLGCAACHQLKEDGKQVASNWKAKPLSDLGGASGCLAENVATNGAANVPRYGLSAKQRESLVAVLKASAEETPNEKLHRTLASLNCYACHQRGQLGGVEKERDVYFESTQKEMGDEGRLPPILTGVGDKLRAEFLKHVLNNGGEDRKNYMVAKMPKFGGGNANPLADLLVSVDLKHDPLPARNYPEPEYRTKAAGRHLVGAQALSCIKCHDFAEHPSTGIRAISLTRMTARLRPEWFDRYMRDPQVYRPGTRMPAPWPFGQATIRDVLAANVDLQIGAVWMYLADGGKAAVPVGLVREPIELKPTDSPIVYRNFIEGAGSRAVGVGYPEQVNLAWDANDMRLALIWHGAFIDASRHWNGRGVGYEAPLGDHLIELAPNAPLAKLASPNDPWPATLARDSGFRFLGYKLDQKQQPTFRYSFAGVTIEDQPTPLKADGQPFAGLRRTLTLIGSTDGPLYYRAAVASKIEKTAEGEYRMDGFWTMKLTAPKPSGVEGPWLRQAGNKWELLVPVNPSGGKAVLTQDYLW